MSAKVAVIMLMLLLSVGVGLVFGEWFYRLYLSAIPTVGQSQFNASASHVAYLMYGACVGGVLFVWWLIGMGVGGMLKRAPKAQVSAGH